MEKKIQQTVLYLTGDPPSSLDRGSNCKFVPLLLREHENIAFNLESRMLIFNFDENIRTALPVRLSPKESHLLLALIYFYPHHVSNTMLALGYGIHDLAAYYELLMKEDTTKWILNAEYAITEGIERLRKKLKVLGITIPRIRNLGYVLSGSAAPPLIERVDEEKRVLLCR